MVRGMGFSPHIMGARSIGLNFPGSPIVLILDDPLLVLGILSVPQPTYSQFHGTPVASVAFSYAASSQLVTTCVGGLLSLTDHIMIFGLGYPKSKTRLNLEEHGHSYGGCY